MFLNLAATSVISLGMYAVNAGWIWTDVELIKCGISVGVRSVENDSSFILDPLRFSTVSQISCPFLVIAGYCKSVQVLENVTLKTYLCHVTPHLALGMEK